MLRIWLFRLDSNCKKQCHISIFIWHWTSCQTHRSPQTIDARYRLVLNDTEISSCRTKSQYQYRYQYLRFANSIPITIPILQIFHFNTNTNTDTSIFKKRYQYQFQYLRFLKKIPIPISIPKYCDTVLRQIFVHIATIAQLDGLQASLPHG